ncbi:MAG: hypothetical protein KKG10_12575 [Proteobacteria bacterium]|nr:hypothetical protein [Pseudomonadota bacterium]
MIKLLNSGTNGRKPWRWTETNEARARDIKEIIDKYKRYWPLTERFVHYRLIGSHLVSAAHWHKYANQAQEQVDIYPAIIRTLKWMRIDDKVPWESITDEHRLVTPKVGFESVDQFIKQEMGYFLSGYQKCVAAKQKYYLEVWIEKNTLIHMVRPIANEFCRRTVVCRGYNSLSFQADFYNRAAAALMRDQIPVILYFGDWDPSGCDMPYAIMKTLEELGLTKVEIYRCGINPEHFAQLQAKPVPIKTKDPRSKNFIKQHGTTAYELDAFEPEALRKLVRESLEAFTDMEVLEADLDQEEEDIEFLDDLSSDVQEYIVDRLGQY